MKTSIYIFHCHKHIDISTGCSDSDDPKPEQQIDLRTGYYFDGTVKLTNLQNNKPVYEIPGLLAMMPNAYGYDIHIPTPRNIAASVSLLGCDIETKDDAVGVGSRRKNSNSGLPGRRDDCLQQGSFQSAPNSGNIPSPIVFRFKCHCQYTHSKTGNRNFCIYTNPKTKHAWTDTENGTVWAADNELATIKFPKKTGLRLYPYSFSDSYRPYWQPHL